MNRKQWEHYQESRKLESLARQGRITDIQRARLDELDAMWAKLSQTKASPVASNWWNLPIAKWAWTGDAKQLKA